MLTLAKYLRLSPEILLSPTLTLVDPRDPQQRAEIDRAAEEMEGLLQRLGPDADQMLLIHLSVLGKGAENPCPPGSLHEPPLVAAECQGRSGHAAKEKIKKELPQTWEQPIAWDYYTSGRGGSQ